MTIEERKQQLEEEFKKKGYKVQKTLEYVAEEEMFKGIVEDMEGKRLQVEIFGLAGLEECLMELLESDDPEDKAGQIRTHKLRNIPHANNSQIVIPPPPSSTKQSKTSKSEGTFSLKSESDEEQFSALPSTPKVESPSEEIGIRRRKKSRNPIKPIQDLSSAKLKGTEMPKPQKRQASGGQTSGQQTSEQQTSEQTSQQEQQKQQQEQNIQQQKQQVAQQKQMAQEAGVGGATPGQKSKKEAKDWAKKVITGSFVGSGIVLGGSVLGSGILGS
jgi:hypothetical protein